MKSYYDLRETLPEPDPYPDQSYHELTTYLDDAIQEGELGYARLIAEAMDEKKRKQEQDRT